MSQTEQTVSRGSEAFADAQRPFLEYLAEWAEGLAPVSLEGVIRKAGGADRTAVVVVDLLEGFCRRGPLASERVEARIGPIVELLKAAHGKGVRRFALAEDAHKDNAKEFGAYPPHCVAGSREARTVEEIRDLPFYESMTRIQKNSIAPYVDTDLEKWATGGSVRTFIVVGDCTDICVYQTAVYLRCLANQRGYDWEVIVPADGVDTFDTPLESARETGAPPHPADLFHRVFLYHMKTNGVRVTRAVV